MGNGQVQRSFVNGQWSKVKSISVIFNWYRAALKAIHKDRFV